MPLFTLRDYAEPDRALVNALALEAFEQFKHESNDWPTFRSKISDMATLAGSGELIVAALGERLIGAVAYVGPHRPKAAFFRSDWSIMRMLVVSPSARGRGVGKALAEECLRLARRDHSKCLALHTSPIMSVALPMYLRMGFHLHANVPPIHGVVYNVYIKELDA